MFSVRDKTLSFLTLICVKYKIKDMKRDRHNLSKSELIEALPLACSNELAAVEFFEQQRWGNLPVCAHCGSVEVYKMADAATGERSKRFLWRCRECKKQYTVRIGTVYEETRLELRHWCYAFWRAATSKKGVAALEIMRHCQISYKSALFLMNRIRFAMAPDPEAPKLFGDSEKLDWFKIINIAGMKLADQELLNAIYTGPWLADAKRWFSRSGGPAYQIGEKYVNGTPIRQDFLEKSLEWISGDKIDGYMGLHQHDADSQELWQYFQEVIAWVERTFPTYRKIMKGLDWGGFYNKHKTDHLNAAKLERRVVELIEDDEVNSKKGIYEYLLTGDEKTLSLRVFDEKTKVTLYEKQKGICPKCRKHFELNEMEADHVKPWHEGGKTDAGNCQMLCKDDNRRKSGK